MNSTTSSAYNLVIKNHFKSRLKQLVKSGICGEDIGASVDNGENVYGGDQNVQLVDDTAIARRR